MRQTVFALAGLLLFSAYAQGTVGEAELRGRVAARYPNTPLETVDVAYLTSDAYGGFWSRNYVDLAGGRWLSEYRLLDDVWVFLLPVRSVYTGETLVTFSQGVREDASTTAEALGYAERQLDLFGYMYQPAKAVEAALYKGVRSYGDAVTAHVFAVGDNALFLFDDEGVWKGLVSDVGAGSEQLVLYEGVGAVQGAAIPSSTRTFDLEGEFLQVGAGSLIGARVNGPQVYFEFYEIYAP